jgi:hypothetical protein
MKREATKVAKQGRIIKVGETYRDVTRGALATVLDHEIVGGKRTGRVIVMGTRAGEHFPQPWISAAKDLVEIEEPRPGSASRGGRT